MYCALHVCQQFPRDCDRVIACMHACIHIHIPNSTVGHDSLASNKNWDLKVKPEGEAELITVAGLHMTRKT